MAKASKKICKAINTKGKKCIVPAAKSSDYCFRHKKKWLRLKSRMRLFASAADDVC